MLRGLLWLFSAGVATASMRALRPDSDPYWRDAAISGLQSAGVFLIVVPPLLAVRELFARQAVAVPRSQPPGSTPTVTSSSTS